VPPKPERWEPLGDGRLVARFDTAYRQRRDWNVSSRRVTASAGAICLAFLVASCGYSGASAGASASQAAGTARTARLITKSGPSASCEQRLADDAKRGIPDLVIVGASFTAGVGTGAADRSWAVLLARMLHWNADVYGVAGAGYVHLGADHLGPVAAELARIDLRKLAPALVIVQAGHDDIGVPVRIEERRVRQVVALIRAEAPDARIALVTVYATHSPAPAAYRIDRAIVTAGRAADPGVIIMDPLAAHWSFQRAPDGLHPTKAGSVWIARKVAEVLRVNGVDVRGAAGRPTVCDYGVPYPAGKHRRIRVPPPGTLSARTDPP
jgi:lysophospholipase L1-like esterase